MSRYFSRKHTRIALAIALLTAVIAVPFFLLSKKTTAYQAIPSEAAIVLEFNSLPQALKAVEQVGDAAGSAILELPIFQQTLLEALEASRILQHNEAVKNAFLQERLLAALTLRPTDSLHALFVLKVALESEELGAALQANSGTGPIFPYHFRSNTLWKVVLPDRRNIVFSLRNNLLIFSQSAESVEDALAQAESSANWWAQRKLLERLSPSAPLRMSLRPEVLVARLASGLLPAQHQLPDLLTRNLEWIGTAWDGHSLATLVEPRGFLRLLPNWGRATESDMFAVLPANTVLMARAGFDNRSLFFEKIANELNPDFEAYVLPWIGREAAFVVTQPFSEGLSDDQFIVLAVRDTVLARTQLDALGRQQGLLKRYDYQTFTIRQFAENAWLAPLVGNQSGFQNPAAAMVGNYMVLAASPTALELWIDKYVVSETLVAHPGFLQMAGQRTEGSGQSGFGSGALVLVNMAYLSPVLKGIFQPKWINEHSTEIQSAAKIGFAGLDFHADKNASGGVQVHIAHGPLDGLDQSVATPGFLWKTALAAEVNRAPSLVALKDERGMAVLAQDQQGQLYCLNAGGQLRWRRQLSAPLLSEVQGIDFLGNGTTCFFFNTADRIWLLDENGRDMEGFPLKLQSPATNGIIAVDFDKNLKYNYFVACENGNVYGYDQFGKPLSGWNPQSGMGQVTAPVLHFQHKEKDYLVLLNRAGRLSVFGKNGAVRFAPVQFGGLFEGVPQADVPSKSPRIVCFNTAGKAFVCSLEGQVFSLQAGSESDGTASGVFAALSGDARFEYAVLAEKKLSVGGYEGGSFKNFVSKKTNNQADTLFGVVGKRLGMLDQKARLIWMLDGRGQVQPGFPLAGSTAFRVMDWAGKGEVLIVGNGNNVYAYRL